ncbi:MAG: Gfo/Idh/MocA family oxidoreductase [Victivallales bacterium]|jgi:predicted dehydrogenase|nr:Gfo/Idh/MocA family oxidoreductase [Victivallales bacterium]
MGKKLNVALVGCWHPHVPRYYPILQKREDTELTCIWDSTPARGEEWSKKLGVPFVADYDALLRRDDVDAICIVAETCRHAELIEKAALAGKHIFTEKAFTLTVAEATKACDAVKKANVKFGIAYIRATTPAFALGKTLMDNGLLGDVNMVRIRNGVDASKMNDLPPDWFDKNISGGGAWIDLACHQMYLMDWMLGEPLDISANAINYFGRDVEDNVCAIVRFKNGTLGVAESTCSTFYSPYMFEIYGRKGSYICRIDAEESEIQLEANNLEKLRTLLPGVELKEEIIGGVVSNDSVNSLFGARAKVKVPVAQLPAQKEPIELWLDEILYGKANPFNIDCGYRLTRLMAGGVKALDEKRTITF